MKLLIIPLFIICFLQIGIAQDINANKPNAIYIEGLGIGMRYSINYERHFQIKESNFGFSLSGGVAPNFVDPLYLYFPLRFTMGHSFGHSSVGVGMNYMWGFYWQHGFLHPEDLTWSTDYWLFPKINYQYKFENNLFLDIEANFISEKWESNQNIYSYLLDLPFNKLELYNNHFVVWPGLSIGYTF